MLREKETPKPVTAVKQEAKPAEKPKAPEISDKKVEELKHEKQLQVELNKIVENIS